MIWFGKRGEAFFDFWFVVHVAFWFAAGATMAAIGWSWWVSGIVFTVGAAAWELLEKKIIDEKLHLVKHPESAINSWGSDMLAAYLGGYVGFWLALAEYF